MVLSLCLVQSRVELFLPPVLLHWHVSSSVLQSAQVNLHNSYALIRPPTIRQDNAPRVHGQGVAIRRAFRVMGSNLSSGQDKTLRLNGSGPQENLKEPAWANLIFWITQSVLLLLLLLHDKIVTLMFTLPISTPYSQMSCTQAWTQEHSLSVLDHLDDVLCN